MTTLHVVSHTHWDREWYLSFQRFRLKLVRFVDDLLSLMHTDQHFKHFMLDGQTIVLDDYLQIRPEREGEIMALVQNGRLIIGPWHILPDEFLVSPEATIRNLLQGDRTSRRFGQKMMVGYIPDPFGHIGQMPQILQGFEIHNSVLQRGLSDESCEFWWQSPDGSRVLMIYLRDGYGNAAHLPTSRLDDFIREIQRLRDSLLPHSTTSQVLIMLGNDHMQPSPDTSSAIACANEQLNGDSLVFSSLPEYLAAIQDELDRFPTTLQTVVGELRSSKRHHLLPGVLSTRIWIKQRNHACETLLEKWAEPFSTFSQLIPASPESMIGHLKDPAPILRHAWRLLMECHPHDSICGCSIDQVHEEMRPRFDQVEQIAEEITRQSLEAIASQVDTRTAESTLPLAILVFNPLDGPRTDIVNAVLPISSASTSFEIIDEFEKVIPHSIRETRSQEVAYLIMDRENVLNQLAVAQDGRVTDRVVKEVRFHREEDALQIHATLSDFGEPDARVLFEAMHQLEEAMTDPSINRFILQAEVQTTEVSFIANNIPERGYKTFWLRPASQNENQIAERLLSSQIENEYFTVRVSSDDGTFSVTDKRNGMSYSGLNHFEDGGDCGDEYNFCPPAQDKLVTGQVQSIRFNLTPVEQSVEIILTMMIPAGLAPDRQTRSLETIQHTIVTRLALRPGVPRLDVHTEVNNQSCDHRLRVQFPVPFQVDYAEFDGHFEIVRRPVGIPPYDQNWAEEPRPEKPQRAFTCLSDGKTGLLVANRGMPEVEVRNTPDGNSEVLLTLLRCVGWLSRGDLKTRRGHAGPSLPTPGAQMLGHSSFDYSIIPHSGNWQQDFQQAYAFNTPMRAEVSGLHSGQIPAQGSFLKVSPNGWIISAIKSAEDQNGWIVRGYNSLSKNIQASLTPWKLGPEVYRVNLSENELEKLAPDPDGNLNLTIHGYEIVTVKFLQPISDQ